MPTPAHNMYPAIFRYFGLIFKKMQFKPQCKVAIIFIELFCSLNCIAEQVDLNLVDKKTFSGIVRCMGRCDIQDAIDLGMHPTGSTPVFPNGYGCPGIDEGWAVDYSRVRSRPALHGGIDIPSVKGTPIIAIADGQVVSMFDNHETAVGIRIFIQHSPQDTGLPFWTYSEYAHLSELPNLIVGQIVKMGEVVGKTSNSGISGHDARVKAGDYSSNGAGKVRRDALHFSIMYSDKPDYVVINRVAGYLIPVNGKWMDPIAFYRREGPYDSDSVEKLSVDNKKVDIPFRDSIGNIYPAGNKLIWPYECTIHK